MSRYIVFLMISVVACDGPGGDSPVEYEEDSQAAAASQTTDSVDSDDGDDNGDAEVSAEPVDAEPPEQEPEVEQSVDDIPAVIDTLCEEREPCEKMAQFDAGVVDGTSLSVFEIALHERGEQGREPNMEDCAPFEYWLVESEDGQMVDHIKLRRLCNDGYGFRRLGEDDVEVDDNTFAHHQVGGSNWMWAASVIVELAPLRIIEEYRTGYWTLGPNREDEFWDWTGPAGSTEWAASHCDSDNDELGPGELPEDGTYHYDHVMQIEVDGEFRNEGWKYTELGNCSTVVDSGARGDDDDGGGFVVYGEAGDPDDASFRAVMSSPTELFLEIRDDRWIDGADSWIYDDHIEIWTGPRTSYHMHCLEPEAPSQWGIGLFDDDIYPGYNDPSPAELDVRRHLVGDEENPDVIRMKIEFESSPEALTIVYSDSDDGESQQRLIATSDLRHGDAASLGATRTIDTDDGRCSTVDGRLKFEDHRDYDPMHFPE